jgi:hypothetical protein
MMKTIKKLVVETLCYMGLHFWYLIEGAPSVHPGCAVDYEQRCSFCPARRIVSE